MGITIELDQERPDRAALAEATRVLSGNGVVIMPTDSVYGIGCAATPHNPAHARIFAIKRRDRAQTLPWLVAGADALGTYATHVPGWATRLARRCWPGALTLVVSAADVVDGDYVAADGTVAVRVPNSPLVRALAAALGPLAVTSANVHGAPAATEGRAIDPRLVAAADLVLDAGPAPLGVASTIVDATGPSPRILREGAIPPAVIRAAANPACVGVDSVSDASVTASDDG